VPTASLSLVEVGMATNDITANLAGHGALIQRGVNTFAEKIQKVAGAGAAFAIIYNNRGVDQRVFMDATSFVPIPAVFITQTDGEALRDFLRQHTDTTVQLRLESARYTFGVTNTLSCEHVAVRLATDHPRRGDLRLTLLSPAGTRSVLQQLNNDQTLGPTDWTYYSTHHFYESSAGTWTVEVTDEDTGSVGSVQSVSLILFGVAIADTDHDGLDDTWEMKYFHTLSARPEEDPDGDGYSNLREQIMGTNPLASDLPFQVDVSSWNVGMERLSWPGTPNSSYQIWAGNEVAGPLSMVTNLPGRFPETEWFIPSTNGPRQFFRIQAAPLK
jgi:subtilisin-like proprotein convertase family protein